VTGQLLETTDISVSFGGVKACERISLGVDRGEIVGLTGPNGSGKSTYLNALLGLVPASGTLVVDGEQVALGAPAPIRRRGVVRTFQSPQNWLSLSVLENAVLGSSDRTATGLLATLCQRRRVNRHERARWAEAADALERVGLGTVASASASVLTYGQQRLLELARAIVARPRVLLLDEPAAGLNASETDALAMLLADLGREGVACVVVDHKIDFLDAISARIVVLQLGSVIAEGRPVEIWHQPGVIDAYLGRSETTG